MMKILSDSVRTFATLAGAALLCGLPSCAKPIPNPTQQSSSRSMEYEQRQREVERVRLALEQGRDFSPAVLRQYTERQPEELRRDLYALFWRMATESQEQPKRTGVVECFLSRISAETTMLGRQLLKWLQDFRKEDFDQNALVMLNALPWTEDYCPEVIRLTGIAGAQRVVPRLQAQVKDQPLRTPPQPGYHNTNTWAALLALARLGDEQALAEVIRRVLEEQDIVVRATILFSDLGYTMRPAAFDTLKVYLNSDKRLPAVKNTVPGRMEAARAAAVFSRYIRNFPIQETDFTEPQTLQARAWANSQTSWQFK
jgi:hypothetical protein